MQSGISLVSEKQACEISESEIPDFDIINVANAVRAQ